MFLRIKLKHGADHLRFFWRFCEKNLPPRIFRMAVLTFGMISSPFQAIDVVLKHADMLENVYPLAAEEVRNQIYELMFDIKLTERKENFDTKRTFLETSATIFDPLGLLSPFVMRIKLLFQKVWLSEEKEAIKTKKGWDTRLPPEIQSEWNSIKEEISTLNEIKIRRCFHRRNLSNSSYLRLVMQVIKVTQQQFILSEHI